MNRLLVLLLLWISSLVPSLAAPLSAHGRVLSDRTKAIPTTDFYHESSWKLGAQNLPQLPKSQREVIFYSTVFHNFPELSWKTFNLESYEFKKSYKSIKPATEKFRGSFFFPKTGKVYFQYLYTYFPEKVWVQIFISKDSISSGFDFGKYRQRKLSQSPQRTAASLTEGTVCTNCSLSPTPAELPLKEAKQVTQVIDTTNACSEVPESYRSTKIVQSLQSLSPDSKLSKFSSCIEGSLYSIYDLGSSFIKSLEDHSKNLSDQLWEEAKIYNKNTGNSLNFFAAMAKLGKRKAHEISDKLKENHVRSTQEWNKRILDPTTAKYKKIYGEYIALGFFTSFVSSLAFGVEEKITELAPLLFSIVQDKLNSEKDIFFQCLNPTEQLKYSCRVASHLLLAVEGGILLKGNKTDIPEEVWQQSVRSARDEHFSTSEVLNNSSLGLSGKVSSAEKILKRKLSQKEKDGIQKADLVGTKELGKTPDQTPSVYNYTQSQLLRKYKILTEAGFSKKETRALIRSGISGLSPDPIERTLTKLIESPSVSETIKEEIFDRLSSCTESTCTKSALLDIQNLEKRIDTINDPNFQAKLTTLSETARKRKVSNELFSYFQQRCIYNLACSETEILEISKFLEKTEKIDLKNSDQLFFYRSPSEVVSFSEKIKQCMNSQLCIELALDSFSESLQNLRNFQASCPQCDIETQAKILHSEFGDKRSRDKVFRMISACAVPNNSSNKCDPSQLLIVDRFHAYTSTHSSRGVKEDPFAPDPSKSPDAYLRKQSDIQVQLALGDSISEIYDMSLIHSPYQSLHLLSPKEANQIKKYILDHNLDPKRDPDYAIYRDGDLKIFDAYNPSPDSPPITLAKNVEKKVFKNRQADHILINLSRKLDSLFKRNSGQPMSLQSSAVHEIQNYLNQTHQYIKSSSQSLANGEKAIKLRQVVVNIGEPDDPYLIEIYPNYNPRLVPDILDLMD